MVTIFPARIVREYQRIVLFRVGRCIGTRGPGIVLLVPLIDRPMSVYLREINPPPNVQEAMTRQMSAERSRRAVVTEAEGAKQASITVAEGEKQAAILSAEGDRQAAILRAEGFALALSKIFEVAQGVDQNTMRLQYLDALRAIGTSDSTKFVLPLELAGLVSGLTGRGEDADRS